MKLFLAVVFVFVVAFATCTVNRKTNDGITAIMELENINDNPIRTPRKIRDENGTCGDNIFWSFNSNTHTLTISGTGQMKNYTVISIPWSSSVQQMQKVIIEEGVTSIGDYIFYKRSSLSSIKIPTSVTYIGSGAFYDCSSLESIEIPSSVTYIGNSAFNICIKLKSIEIPMNVTSIAASTFHGCTSLTSISIPSSVNSIEDYAFCECSNLISISIPSSVTSIGTYAFYSCTNLTSISILSSDITISYCAFSGCTSLTSVEIFSKKLSIRDDAFGSCPNLTKVIYHESNSPSCPTNVFNISAATKFCVPINYTGSSFCGVNTFSNSSTFDHLRNNSCYEVFICGESISDVYVEKRAEVKRWESESNGCMNYYCDNSSGMMNWSKCESSDKIKRICNDGQCKEHLIDDDIFQYAVEIEVYIDEMNTTQTNADDIKGLLSTTSGVSENEIEVEIETDEHNNIMRIIVYVNDEEDAIAIYRTADSCKRGN